MSDRFIAPTRTSLRSRLLHLTPAPSDNVVIEDESGRIRLKGSSVRPPVTATHPRCRRHVLTQVNIATLCTGVVMAGDTPFQTAACSADFRAFSTLYLRQRPPPLDTAATNASFCSR